MRIRTHLDNTLYLISLLYLSMSRGAIALTPYWDPTMKTETWPQNYLNKLKLYSECHHILNKKDCLAGSTFYWKGEPFSLVVKSLLHPNINGTFASKVKNTRIIFASLLKLILAKVRCTKCKLKHLKLIITLIEKYGNLGIGKFLL